MTNEVLQVQLINTFSWLHDVFIPGGMAIITGAIVGYSVGFGLRKKQLKDTRVEELRKENEKAFNELIAMVNIINDEFPKNTRIMFDFYKYRNDKAFLDKADEGFKSIDSFKIYLLNNDFRLDEKFSIKAKELYDELFDFYKKSMTAILVIGTIKEFDKPKYDSEKNQIYDKLFVDIKQKHDEILNKTGELLKELKDYRKRFILQQR
jgi:hypothetical protein